MQIGSLFSRHRPPDDGCLLQRVPEVLELCQSYFGSHAETQELSVCVPLLACAAWLEICLLIMQHNHLSLREFEDDHEKAEASNKGATWLC